MTSQSPAQQGSDRHDPVRLQPLWQPLTIGNTVLRNRVMTTALTLQYGQGGLISDRHVAYYRERAAGGVGLLVSEQLTASRMSESTFASAVLAYEPAQVAGFARIAKALEGSDSRFFAQFLAAGASGNSTYKIDHWQAVRGPSRQGVPGGDVPLPLTEGDIAAIAEDFRRSARNVLEGGLHGIEIHGAHGYLVGQFLSPYYNRRTDQYGGDVANRCRLAIQLGRAIRDVVGSQFPVGISLSYDEFIGNVGITQEDTLEQLKVLVASGVFNFFDLSAGANFVAHYQIPPMSVPHGFSLPFGQRAKQVVGDAAAIFICGRVTTLEMAADAVRSGQGDVIGMARAHLADPHLIRKARAGSVEPITRCVGMNACLRRAVSDQPVACALNPATGRERALAGAPRVTTSRKTIAVVGGGPAGLHFSAVAARAGHTVTLFERADQLGGHLRRLACLPGREEWQLAIDDLVEKVRVTPCRIQLNRSVSAADLLATGAQAIVVATGSSWDAQGATFNRFDREFIPGVGSTRALGLDRAIDVALAAESVPLGKKVVILDSAGTLQPLGLADLLMSKGTQVSLVTPNASLGGVAAAELELPLVLPPLLSRGLKILVGHDIEEIQGTTLTVANVYGGPTDSLRDVDTVVFAVQRNPAVELFQELSTQHPDVRCIGDASSPRLLEAVIFEAEALARSI